MKVSDRLERPECSAQLGALRLCGYYDTTLAGLASEGVSSRRANLAEPL